MEFRVFLIISCNMHIIRTDLKQKGNSKMFKKPVMMILFVYVLLTFGAWIFLNAGGSSYNRLSEEKIIPFSVNADGENAEIKILGKIFRIDISGTAPENRAWLSFYLAVSDDIRISCCISYYTDAFFP